jgi:hypothetical protein
VHAIEACDPARNPFNDAISQSDPIAQPRPRSRAVKSLECAAPRLPPPPPASASATPGPASPTLGHALGAVGHVHPAALPGSLRVALAWNAEADPARHAAVAQALGVPAEGRPVAAVAADLAPAYDRFLRAVGLPISLADDGLSAADADRLARVTMAPENKPMRDANIREVRESDALDLARAVLTAA